MTKIKLTLKPYDVTKILITITVLLLFASIGSQLAAYFSGKNDVLSLIRIFSLDVERNVPTAFSVFLLLLVSWLLLLIYIAERKMNKSLRWYWSLLSAGFAFMAIDEAWSFHEKLIDPMRHLLGSEHLGILYFAWVVPAILMVAVLGLLFFKFYMRLPVTVRKNFLWAAIVYLTGAVGVEAIGGLYNENHGDDLAYKMLTNVEETMELGGLIVFVNGLLTFIGRNFGSMNFSFSSTNASEVVREKPKTISV